MRIVFKEPCRAILGEYEVRDPKEDEVQVKVYYSLISNGTEKAYLSESPNTAKKFPTTPGYSSAGIITKAGEIAVQKGFNEGDRVFVSYGGHGGYNTKSINNVVKIPDGVSFQEAAFTRLISFPLLGLRRSRLELGEAVVIVGLGMLGLFGVQIAHATGGYPIIGVGNRQVRQEKAVKYGADLVLSPNDPQLTEKIFDYTLAKTGCKGASVVIETSGSEEGLINCMEYTAKHGRVIVSGCNRVMTKPIDFYKYVHVRGLSIIGAHDGTHPAYGSYPGNWTAKRDYSTILNFIGNGRLNASDMIGEIADPHDATDIYNRLLNDREFPLGVIFDWQKI